MKTVLLFGILCAGSQAVAKNAKEDFQTFCDGPMSNIAQQYRSCSYESRTVSSNDEAHVIWDTVKFGSGRGTTRRFVVPVPVPDSGTLASDEHQGSFSHDEWRLAIIVNRDYVAIVGKSVNGSNILRSIGPLEEGTGLGTESAPFACAHPSSRIPFSKIARQPSTRVHTFKKVTVDGENLMVVDLTFKNGRLGENSSVDCQAWFNPTFGNCVKSIVRIGEVAEAKIEAKYRFDAERLILEKVVTTGSRSEFEVRETTTFQNWNFEVVPDEAECRLSFFGLPEPRSNEPARSTPTWVWALLLGVVFLLAAFFVRRREQGA